MQFFVKWRLREFDFREGGLLLVVLKSGLERRQVLKGVMLVIKMRLGELSRMGLKIICKL